MKTAPAMGKQNYSISTALTGDSGEAFLGTLNVSQRKVITGLLDLQLNNLNQIVVTRRAIATELRGFLPRADRKRDRVLALSKRYGELDGEMSYFYATAFAQVGRVLSPKTKGPTGRTALL